MIQSEAAMITEQLDSFVLLFLDEMSQVQDKLVTGTPRRQNTPTVSPPRRNLSEFYAYFWDG